MSDKKARIVVVMEGGLINSILSNMPMEVLVLDGDIEGADEDRVKEISFLDDAGNPWDKREKSYVSIWDVPGEPNIVEHYFRQVEGEKEHANEMVSEMQGAKGKDE